MSLRTRIVLFTPGILLPALAAARRHLARADVVQPQFRQRQELDAIGRLTGTIAHDSNNLLQTDLAPDTAAGIPAERQAGMFEDSFTTRPVGQGTGLGLFEVRSEAGHGTTVTLRLPRALLESAERGD